MEFCGIHLKTILQAVYEISVYDISFEIIILKLRPHLPGANELNGASRGISNLFPMQIQNAVPKKKGYHNS